MTVILGIIMCTFSMTCSAFMTKLRIHVSSTSLSDSAIIGSHDSHMIITRHYLVLLAVWMSSAVALASRAWSCPHILGGCLPPCSPIASQWRVVLCRHQWPSQTLPPRGSPAALALACHHCWENSGCCPHEEAGEIKPRSEIRDGCIK